MNFLDLFLALAIVREVMRAQGYPVEQVEPVEECEENDGELSVL